MKTQKESSILREKLGELIEANKQISQLQKENEELKEKIKNLELALGIDKYLKQALKQTKEVKE